MIINYLKEDIKGASSKKDYVKKGDKVYVIGHNINMVLVSDFSGNKFWVNKNKLSNEKL
jgi:uncharacterized protein YgiM (DUF1202 family)